MNQKKNATMLVVDDEQRNRELLTTLLQLEGYTVEEAQDGFEALAKSVMDIDVILLDVMMPNIDGFEVARRIRHNPLTAEIPILMVTALDGKRERIQAVGTRADDCIGHPGDRVALPARKR